MNAQQEARRIYSDLETAAGEVAYDECRQFKEYGECSYTKLVKRLRRSGCGDVAGSLADTLFGNVDFCEDIVGDRIWWATKTDQERRDLVAALNGMAHPALKKALKNIVARHPEIQ